MPRTCAWCDEAIDDDWDTWVEVKKRDVGSAGATVVAHFHGEPYPCFSEAAAYGWRD